MKGQLMFVFWRCCSPPLLSQLSVRLSKSRTSDVSLSAVLSSERGIKPGSNEAEKVQYSQTFLNRYQTRFWDAEVKKPTVTVPRKLIVLRNNRCWRRREQCRLRSSLKTSSSSSSSIWFSSVSSFSEGTGFLWHNVGVSGKIVMKVRKTEETKQLGG